jgi:PAS domain S-box-containing protein
VVSEQREAVRQRFADPTGASATGTYQVDVVDFGGRRRTLELSLRLIHHEGQPAALEGIGRDITERREAEVALKAERNLLRTLVDHLPGRIFVKDTQGRYLLINTAYHSLVGRTDEEVLGKTVFDLFPRELAERYDQDDRQVLATGVAIHQKEEPSVTSRGEARWLLTTKVPLRDGSDRVVGLVGITTDITERKAAAEALRQNEALLQLSQRIGKVGSWEYRHRSGEFRISPEGLRIFGMEGTGVTPTFELLMAGIHPDDHPRIQAMRQATLDCGEPFVADHRLLLPDGGTRWVHVQAEAIRDPAGQIAGVAGTVQDLTDRVELEQRLRQAQKMEAVGQLAGGIAHDFNNILTVILGHIHVLLMDPSADQPTKDSFQEIEAASQRAARLTRQLLAFSRRQLLQMRPLRLQTALGGMADMLRRLLGEHIELVVACPPELAVLADSGAIDQVFMNLAVNARDAMPQGGHLTIAARSVTVDSEGLRGRSEARVGEFVCLEVTDTGCGMDPSTLSRIFEPFFTTKEVGKGTGLGLATVYGIVQQHSGWIEVTSEPGHGSTFRIYLPLATGEVETPADRPSQPAKVVGGAETILLVEDEPALRAVAKRMLQRAGYQVLEAASGPDALSLWSLHRDEVKLLITDLVMPGGLSGQNLARQLRLDKPGLKVILSSGYSLEALRDTVSLDEAQVFLPKPYEPAKLASTVRSLLDHSSPLHLNPDS